MLLFLDTELTDLPRAGLPAPKLISIGLVSEDGKHAFYGEVAQGCDWTWLDCSDFVMIEVVPRLKGGEYAMSREDLKTRLLTWLNAMPCSLTIAADSGFDVEFLKDLLGQDWPEKLDRKHYDLRPMLADEASGSVFDQSFIAAQRDRGGSEHNALDDAWGNLAGWRAWRKRYKLSDLMVEMPDGLPRVEGWDD